MASTISLSHRSLGRIWAMVVGGVLAVLLTVVLVLAFAGGSHGGTVPAFNNLPNLAPAAQSERCYLHRAC
jgi:hypothetical protein